MLATFGYKNGIKRIEALINETKQKGFEMQSTNYEFKVADDYLKVGAKDDLEILSIVRNPWFYRDHGARARFNFINKNTGQSIYFEVSGYRHLFRKTLDLLMHESSIETFENPL